MSPDNVQTVVLSKIEHPIPLSLQERQLVETEKVVWKNEDGFWKAISKHGDGVDYDFVVGDWMSPYGCGKIADATFYWVQEQEAGTVSSKVVFHGEGNGVVRSGIEHGAGVLMKVAPIDGYEKSHVFSNRQAKDLLGLYFRVRGSFYGKIVQDFFVEGSSRDSQLIVKPGRRTEFFPYNEWSRKTTFKYWLNPTPCDRNLEQKREEHYWHEHHWREP